MSGQDADEIVVGANGAIYRGPVAGPFPATIDEPLSTAWHDLGYASEDGVKFTDGKSTEEIKVWQELLAVRRLTTDRSLVVEFSLMQWNSATFMLAHGGGEITESAPGSGLFQYVPPEPEFLDEGALAIEWQDRHDYRLILPKGMVSDDVESTLTRSAAGMLPITYSALGQSGQHPWFFQTNDPAFAPVAVGSGS